MDAQHQYGPPANAGPRRRRPGQRVPRPLPALEFYLTELLRPADPTGPWGPYAFGLSGFSDVITQFNGANGLIGLHGVNRPDLVGTDASHGCIRLRNADIEKLAGILPIGTPISIRG
ncbi:L,D-transpeptidase [Frankia sp. QA3]|uniref:L,D-transpeptidase n=1 Tax=Frankia sp. QA3 TaxID=710111 RepID=UPI0002E893E6